MSADEAGFLSRWAQRKEAVRRGGVVEATPVPVPVLVPVPMLVESAAPVPAALPAAVEPVAPCVDPAEPLPTLADVALLTRDSDYSRFVGAGVDNGVQQAAMKKLFTDPHFNVMDGLDTYIDDYGKPDPIPLAMLRRMNQSKVLRLFEDDDEEAPKDKIETAATVPTEDARKEPLARTDDHADLQLQPHDAAGRPGPDQGAGA